MANKAVARSLLTSTFAYSIANSTQKYKSLVYAVALFLNANFSYAARMRRFKHHAYARWLPNNRASSTSEDSVCRTLCCGMRARDGRMFGKSSPDKVTLCVARTKTSQFDNAVNKSSPFKVVTSQSTYSYRTSAFVMTLFHLGSQYWRKASRTASSSNGLLARTIKSTSDTPATARPCAIEPLT